MSETKYTFALGQMSPNAEGRRPQALILQDGRTRRDIAYIPYDVAGEILIAALEVGRLARSG